MILLVVDTQKGCFDERLYAFETVMTLGDGVSGSFIKINRNL